MAKSEFPKCGNKNVSLDRCCPVQDNLNLIGVSHRNDVWERSPLFLQHWWNSTISHPSVVTAWSWGQNKFLSKEKATFYHEPWLSWTVCRWHCVKRLLSDSLVLPCDWFSQWEVLIWPLQYPCSIDTWVGPPTPIRLLSVSTVRQTYLRSCQLS